MSKVDVLAKNITVTSEGYGETYNIFTETNSLTNIGDSSTEEVTLSAKNNSGKVVAVCGKSLYEETAFTNILGKNINISAISDKGNALGVLTNDNSSVTIGDSSTEKINIYAKSSTNTSGLQAYPSYKTGRSSSIKVDGKDLLIDVSDGINGMGIVANNVTYRDAVPADDEKTTEVIVNAENTTIKSNTCGIYSLINGRVVLNGNTEILKRSVETDEPQYAIATYGNAVTKINPNGDKTAKLNGDIRFGYKGNTYTANSQVYINLTGSESYLNGNIYAYNHDEAKRKQVDGMTLVIADGAHWDTNADSFVNTLELNNGLINVNSDAETVLIDKSTGAGAVNMKTSGTGSAISTGKFKVQEAASTGRIDFNYDGINADDVAAFDDLYKLVNNSIYVNDDSSLLAVANVEEGLVGGAISTETENHMTGNTIKQMKLTPSTTVEDIGSTAALGILGWREEDVILSQRMGDVREADGDEGPWARFSRGEFEYGGALKNIHNFIQVGYDWVDHDDNWHYGLAVSHNRGKSSYRLGKGEDRSTSLLLYGARLMENGEYYDLTAKIGRLSNEYDVYAKAGHTHGDYDTWGTAFGWEYGRRYQKDNGWFIQPLGKLTVSNINGVDYDTDNGIHVSQDHLTSVLGRLGFEAGKKDGKNNFYVKGFVLHEFGDSVDTSYTYGKLTNSYSAPLGNTWYELGLGGNVKLSEDTYLYADVVRTYGDDFRTPWKWNVGVNYSF